MSLLKKVKEVRDELEAQGQDPWNARLDNALHGVEVISTAALLDFLRAPATTGTARRLAGGFCCSICDLGTEPSKGSWNLSTRVSRSCRVLMVAITALKVR